MARGVSKTSKRQELRWQAEGVVRQAVENTPAYKKAVNQTMKELTKVQKSAAKTIRGKKGK